uniref:ATP synthase F0 subunit 8 n=1 Tax=Cymbium olla TaxID=543401 RepID=C8XQT8_CYMOL|nr:ATP synthase F0 subunit 8 [Cymbium olla]ACF04869.1 ATP synthase F0 subunit 8 [Cymbium olla]
MPQLSPLNWVFLFMLFWFMISAISVMIWWSSKMNFNLESGFKDFNENKWNW